jgi:hypothetical protein
LTLHHQGSIALLIVIVTAAIASLVAAAGAWIAARQLQKCFEMFSVLARATLGGQFR